jgi:hypothetical protein
MRLFRKKPPDPPRGVCIVRPGLWDVECDVLLDPGRRRRDEAGSTVWIAVPREPVEFRLGEDRVTVAYLPARTAVELMLPVREQPNG